MKSMTKLIAIFAGITVAVVILTSIFGKKDASEMQHMND